MKQNYYLLHCSLFYFFLCCFSATVLAQGTSPAPQSLPFSQDFHFSPLANLSSRISGLKTAQYFTFHSGMTTYVTTGVLLADLLVAKQQC
jgi:hypothetical protein